MAKKGDTVRTTLGGVPAEFKVLGTTTHGYRGRWTSGPLAGREACPERDALADRQISPRQEKPRGQGRGRRGADELVAAYGQRVALRYARVRAEKAARPEVREHWRGVHAELQEAEGAQ